MSKEKIDLLIEGGKATSTPALAQQLGPLKINISEILKQINDKTLDLKGIKVPVKVFVDTITKEVEIHVGSPPVSELIKKELNVQKGSGTPNKIKIGNLAIENIIKVAKAKQDSMYTPSLKAAVKSVLGSCNSLGVLVENKEAKLIEKDIVAGQYDTEINQVKTEPSPEKKKELDHFFKKLETEQKKILEAAAKEKEATAAQEKAKEEKPADKPGVTTKKEEPVKVEKKDAKKK